MARRPPRATASTSKNRGPRIVAGAVAGLGAWVVGYLVTFILVMIKSVDTFGSLDLGSLVTWKAIGLLLHNGHFVDATARGSSVNFVTETGGIYLILLVALPLLLFLMGFMVSSGGYGPVVGASIVIGYLPMTLLGTFVFEVRSFLVSVSPALATSILLMGLVYPVVFGGLGGLVSPS